MKHQFHPGDLVRFRDWDDLAAEYGFLLGAIEPTIACPFGLSRSDYDKLNHAASILEIRYGYSTIAGGVAYYAKLAPETWHSIFALDILLPVSEVTMNINFQPGDLVVLRDWDELVAEYGLVSGAKNKTIAAPFGVSHADYTALQHSPVPIKQIRYGYSVIAHIADWYAVLDVESPLPNCNAFSLSVLAHAEPERAELAPVSDMDFDLLMIAENSTV